MDPIQQFEEEKKERILSYEKDDTFHSLSQQWLKMSMEKEYTYNFSWMGRPIIQNPVDIIALQEIIWNVKPDLIIETGIAHGGSLIYYASLLELNAVCGYNPHAKIIGIDIELREHNRKKIMEHPLYRRIHLLDGSSVSSVIIEKVYEFSKNYNTILVILDSNHTHEHVLAELNAYAPLVTCGSYCIVFDTHIEYFTYAKRPWGKGNNPLTALKAYLEQHNEFEVDPIIDNKLFISVAPGGYLKRIY